MDVAVYCAIYCLLAAALYWVGAIIACLVLLITLHRETGTAVFAGLWLGALALVMVVIVDVAVWLT